MLHDTTTTTATQFCVSFSAQLAALNEGQQQPPNAQQQHNSSLLSMEHIEIVVANFLVQQKKALFRDDYHTLIRAFRALDQVCSVHCYEMLWVS